jgi:hypothetical protein
MDEAYYDKAARLLDIIHDLVDSGKMEGAEQLPFTLDDSDEVCLHPVLQDELSKDSNRDLQEWAEMNLRDLF